MSNALVKFIMTKSVSKFIKLNICILTISDSREEKNDESGDLLVNRLQKAGHTLYSRSIAIDEIDEITIKLKTWINDPDVNIIITTGGTGITKRDVTPEAIKPLLDKTIPGIEESIRSYGLNRTRYAMLSRSVVGIKKSTLVLALPGSTKGALESINAIFPEVLHLFDILKGAKH